MIKSVAAQQCIYRIEAPQDLIGYVAVSKCGRDKGKPGIIIGWQNDLYALISDGKLRTLAKPKKKNMKHLIFTNYRPGGIREKLLAGGYVTDRMINEGVAAFSGMTGEGRQYG